MAESAATSEPAPFLWRGSFLDIPQDEFIESIKGQPTVEDLSGIEEGLRKIPETQDVEETPYLMETIAVRRVLILEEIAKRLEHTKAELLKQAKVDLEQRIIASKNQAQSLREEYGIN